MGFEKIQDEESRNFICGTETPADLTVESQIPAEVFTPFTPNNTIFDTPFIPTNVLFDNEASDNEASDNEASDNEMTFDLDLINSNLIMEVPTLLADYMTEDNTYQLDFYIRRIMPVEEYTLEQNMRFDPIIYELWDHTDDSICLSDVKEIRDTISDFDWVRLVWFLMNMNDMGHTLHF